MLPAERRDIFFFLGKGNLSFFFFFATVRMYGRVEMKEAALLCIWYYGTLHVLG